MSAYRNMGEDDLSLNPTSRSSSSSISKTVKFLSALVVILAALSVAFILLFIKQKNDYNSLQSSMSSSSSPSSPPPPSSSTLCSPFNTTSLEYRASLLTTFISLTDNNSIATTAKYLSEKIHLAGSARDFETATYVENLWKSYGIPIVYTETYDTLLSFPQNLSVVTYFPSNGESLHASLHQLPSAGDPQSCISPWLQEYQYLAYSASGSVNTSNIIYANYGSREDFLYLKSINIVCDHCIAIMRYGHLYRGNKVSNAQDYGASAALLFLDPGDFDKGTAFPDGPWASPTGAASGSVWNGNADPSTPGWTSDSTISPYHLDGEALYETGGNTYNWPLPLIPAIPVSQNDVYPILSQLRGVLPSVNSGYQGGFNFTYHIGVGSGTGNTNGMYVHINATMDLSVKPLPNVIAKIPGSVEPDRYVILGNHRDAWQYGTADPISGMSSLSEVVRVLGKMYSNGWRPRRSIIFASWSGEEFALLGSSEHAEKREHEYLQRAVAYLACDIAVDGKDYLNLYGQESLSHILSTTLPLIPAPQIVQNTGRNIHTLYDLWLAASLNTSSQSVNPSTLPTPFLTATGVGTSSDYAIYVQRLGLPMMGMGFTSYSDVYDSVYHTIEDDIYWLNTFIDPTWELHESVSRIWGLMAIQLADNPLLPLYFTNYTAHVIDDFHSMMDSYVVPYNVSALIQHDMALTLVSLSQLHDTAVILDSARDQYRLLATTADPSLCYSSELSLRSLNDRLMLNERGWLFLDGVDTHRWLKHLLWFPSDFDVDGSTPFGLVVDGIVKGEEGEVRKTLTLIRQAVNQVRQIMTVDQ